VWLIDFGLSGFSKSAEDHAMDVLLFKKSAQPFSPAVFQSFWNAYAKANPKAKTVLQTLGEIEQRGRYVVRSQAGA
jgi:tRNA A-37 threonylcarbamoyl transferase component Bud32